MARATVNDPTYILELSSHEARYLIGLTRNFLVPRIKGQEVEESEGYRECRNAIFGTLHAAMNNPKSSHRTSGFSSASHQITKDPERA